MISDQKRARVAVFMRILDLAVILSYLIVELGGEGGAEFVYFQF